MVVGFAGAGNMAAALARGLARPDEGPDPRPEILLTDSGSGRAAALAAEIGAESCGSLEELAERSDVVFLAFKPGGLDQLAPRLAAAKVVVSVLGATSLQRLGDALPEASVVRTMPNVGTEVGEGVICVAEPAGGSELDPSIRSLLERIAEVFVLPEDQIDAATAVMGCAPAFVAHAAGALIEAGVGAGLDRDLASRLVAPTVAGTGTLLRRHEPGEIEVAVASPGGSTEAGLEELRERGVAEGFAAAVRGAIERMEGKR